ncbi:MAG: putative sugar O-methyltransferase [Candidatus Brocadiaceae bacterium]|nr:putative sugar O-methyltransferase [Candidatus Brocadiaceae bacterium]
MPIEIKESSDQNVLAESLTYTDQINYLKKCVIEMLHYRNNSFGSDSVDMPSSDWSEPMAVFNYLINLSDENFKQIRYHTGWTTGDDISKYWKQYPPFNPEKMANLFGYTFYTEDIPEKYHIGEPPIPSIPLPIGVEYKEKVINRDLCRYQSVISNLYSMGITEELSKKEKSVIVEIGAGYGGLAHHLKNILGGKSTYVILDLPEMLLFIGGYLIVNNPTKKIYVYNEESFDSQFLQSEIYNYDFVLLPNYVLEELYKIKSVDLMLNMESFQEMTSKQVDKYLEFGQSKISGYIYSENVDKHPYNKNMHPHTVTTLLRNRFQLFPAPEFYEKYVSGSRKTFYQKSYFGVTKNKEPILPANSTMKLVSGEAKLIGDKFYLTFDKSGKVKFRKKISFTGKLISLGQFVSHKILHFDFKEVLVKN